MCRVEALVKLSLVGEAHQTALNAAALKVEPLPASFSQPQTRFFGMLCRAYAYFVKSQINFALVRYKDAAENAAKALEIEPHNTEIKIFKKNVELVKRALSSSKLEKWAEAVRDYEILHQAMPYDKVIAKSLSQAQVALKESRSEVVLNMESGGDVKEISSLEELKAALARLDKSVKIIYF
ncbi:PREDICTED: TPR repeat-containing thioredoxin TTL2-like [Brassica oleracea var. oleracea]|nr:PREDICTED: TPR repeat-containing thioredoxin TTL2-like [Brassica oleracea var. oleracea]